MASRAGYKAGGKLDLGWWHRQILDGKDYRKKMAHEANWDSWRKAYRGNWDADTMATNLFFKMVRTIVPRVYFRNPSVSVTAQKPGIEYLVFAKLLERIDNKLMFDLRMKKQFKKMVQDGWMFGQVIGKLGYGAQYNASPTPGQHNESPGESRNKERRIEYNSNVQPNMPWFLRTHPSSFIVPKGCDDIDNARWVAHEIVRTVSDVVNDPRFKNTSNLGPNQGANINDQHNRDWDDEISVYEVRDKKTGEAFVFTDVNLENELMRGVDNLQFQGRVPFYTGSFNPDDESFWGVPDAHVLEPIQREANETRTKIMKHRRIAIARILAKNNSIGEDQAAKLVDENVMPVIFMEGDPLTDIRELAGNNIPEDLIRNLEIVVSDARESMGFSRNQFGEYKQGSSDTTATEAKIVQMATEIRVDERRDMMADLLVDVMNDINQLVFRLWTEEQVVQIAGPRGVPVWVKFRPSILERAHYDVKVDPDSSVPETKAAREEKAMAMYDRFAADPLVNQQYLRQMLHHELYGVEYQGLFNVPPAQLVAGLTQQQPMDTRQASRAFELSNEESQDTPVSQILQRATQASGGAQGGGA